jgi:hypothetical protein
MDREKRDFSDKESLGTYAFVQNGSGRIDDPNNLPAWAKGGQMRRGLFAGKYDQILSYLIPRGIAYVIADGVSKKTLYINQKDLASIKAYRPWVSSFDKASFSDTGKEGRGEYFSDGPGTPVKQAQVKKDPISILQNKYDLRPVDDVRAVLDDLVRKGVNHEAEGLPPRS